MKSGRIVSAVWSWRRTVARFRWSGRRWLGSFGRTVLTSIVLPAGLLSGGPSGNTHDRIMVLALPPSASVGSGDSFGHEGPGTFYFFSRKDQFRLFRLVIEHPMGAQDLWRESWSSLTIPASSRHFRVRTASIGAGHLFLAGSRDGGAPLVRSYQIGSLDGRTGETMALSGQVDYYPSSPDVAVRILYLDPKSRILWLGYENGQVESGNPYLVLSDRLLWSDPAGYIPMPSETSLKKGPPPLQPPHVLLPSGQICFSCRFYLVLRKNPEGTVIVNHPIRSPRRVESSMGLLPAGENMGIVLGNRSFLCRIPPIGGRSRLSRCHALEGPARPVAAVWWANRLAYLFPPGPAWNAGGESGGRWAIVAVNPAFLEEKMEKLSRGEPFPFQALLREKGEVTLLPAGARPREQTLSSLGKDLFLFGSRHLYRMVPAP